VAKQAVYPGTFDPLTNGHLDVIKRSLLIFDSIIVLLAENSDKKRMFSLKERLRQVKAVVKQEGLSDKVAVDSSPGLLVDYCRDNGISVAIRGLRPLVDFEFEFEMAMTNRELNSNIETVFIITDQKFFYLRSSLIKDLVRLGAPISDKVPGIIEAELRKKVKSLRRQD
jgi:pantetheine-phosphate adenylyltransferase